VRVSSSLVRGRKSGGRLSFSPQKIKLPRKREKKRKKTQDTRKKKISSTPGQIFGRLAVFHSLTHTVEHEILRETKFEPRNIHPFRLNFSFREKKRATHVVEKSGSFFRFLFSFRVVATFEEKKIRRYIIHTRTSAYCIIISRERSLRVKKCTDKRERESSTFTFAEKRVKIFPHPSSFWVRVESAEAK